jgi:serine phosphatase RsbU (regulator of sigma subunit)
VPADGPVPLGRLLGRETVDRLVSAFARLAGDSHLVVRDAAGRSVCEVGGRSSEANADAGSGDRLAEASVQIVAADRTVGSVEVRETRGRRRAEGSVDVASALANVLGEAAEAALDQRSLAREALARYRELSLLYRIGPAVAGLLDAPSIARAVLAEARRVVRVDAGAVLPAPGIELATHVEGDVRVAAALKRVGLRIAGGTDASSHANVIEPRSTVLGSVLVAPVRGREVVLGVILLARGAGKPSLSAADVQLVAALADHAALAFERAWLHERDVRTQRLDEELAVGRRIQRALMPRSFPTIDGWEFGAAYEAAREVGGDFFDVFRLGQARDRIGLVMADVTGKGMPAALLMADARGLVRAAADHSTGPSDTLERVNRVLVAERRTSLFLTAFHAVLDPSDGSLRYASGGHEPPLIVSADGRSVRCLETAGPLLGAFPIVDAPEAADALAPGESLVLYTDGVTEARDPDRNFYGEDRFRDLLRRMAGSSAGEVVDAIVADVDRFDAGAERADDLTVLVVRRTG